MLTKNQRLTALILFFQSCLFIATGQAQDSNKSATGLSSPTISTLFQDADYSNVSLSPDGKHIALIRNQEGTPILVIVDVTTMKAINQIYFDKKDSVGSYSWANNERLLITLASKQRNKERRGTYGEIYAINLDDNKGKFIFGVRSLVRRGKLRNHVTEADYEKHFAHPTIISYLKDDPEHILISTSQYFDEGMWLYKLNVYNGQIETLAMVDDSKANYKSTKLWYSDVTKELWLRTSHKEEATYLARYDFDKKSWKEFQPKGATFNLTIISAHQDNKQLIVSDYCGNDTISICLFDPQSQELTSLYQVEGYDTDWLYMDNQGAPYALSYFDEYPQFKILDKQHPMAKTLADMLAQFPGHKLKIRWDKTRETKALVSISSDVQPTIWYLLDKEKNNLGYVAQSKKHINAKQMHPQYSFKFQARDNTPIQGYLTLPTKTTKAPSPAVVLVHGGPHSRDYWGFDPQVQLLASRGYAVVQVNFRGSQGFGWAFEKSGFKQWGEKIQYDILDGIHYLTEQQYIDDKRLCIMGASFGGYSAMQSSILAPELFKCTIASAGVYDLPLFIAMQDPKEGRASGNRIGSKELQEQHSPVNAVNKLQAPLLLVHGTKDDRTPLEQAEVLLKQLDKHKKTYEWFELTNEGHSFHNVDNRIKYHEKVLAFLSKYNPVTL